MSICKLSFKIVVIVFLLKVCPSVIYGQNELIRLYEQDEIAKLEQRWRMNTGQKNDFVQSIFMKDAAKSIEKMKSLIENDPNTSLLPVIIERIALYNFSEGLYEKSRKNFEYLYSHFSNDRYGETGLYYLSRCVHALGKTDSSHIILKKFLNRYPNSKYADVAAQELETGLNLAIDETENEELKIQTTSIKPIYTIQTGAFSTNVNANLQQLFLENKGFNATIYKKHVNQKLYYVVCIGEFQKKEQAERFGKNIAQKYGLNEYRIVDFNQLIAIR